MTPFYFCQRQRKKYMSVVKFLWFLKKINKIWSKNSEIENNLSLLITYYILNLKIRVCFSICQLTFIEQIFLDHVY